MSQLEKVAIVVSVAECSDDLTLSHNASWHTTPLFFNETVVLGLDGDFQIPYDLPITYVWYMNGDKMDESGNHLDQFFGEGTYNVSVVASYKLPRCDPCTRTRSLPLTVDGMWLQHFIYLFNVHENIGLQ